MRGTASADTSARKPERLMHRLAMIAGAGDRAEREPSDRQPGIWTYFGLGLAGGCFLSAVALLALHMLTPAGASAPPSSVPPAIAALSHWLPQPTNVPPVKTAAVTVSEDRQPDRFDMVINRSARDRARFGLRLEGADSRSMNVLLRNVPATIRMSHGERRDASTWAVKAADLPDLHLALHDGAPDAFEIKIQVLTPSGAVAANSIARVRLVGRAREKAQPLLETAAVPPAPSSPAVSRGSPFETQTTIARRRPAPEPFERVARASPPPAAAEVERPVRNASAPEGRHWPEGARGLGAMPRESDRQVWWKLPALTWSPFLDVVGR